jgi:uncharacterized repeat protein (TIGR01451 family)
VPAQTTFVSATPTCATPATGGTGTITCTVGTLTPGASATYTFVVHVDPAAGGSINNTATAATTAADPNPANDSASASTVLSPGPTDLSITKVANGNRFALGSPVTYTITVTNEGPGLAAGVTVTDTIPAGSTFVSATPSQGTCTGTTTVVCSLGTLTPAASATISLVIQLPSTQGPLANTATVTAINAETNPPNNASTSTVQIVASQDIPTASPLALAILGLTLAAAGWFVQRR